MTAEPEPRAHEERELDVPHPHPLRVGEHEQEEGEPGSERAEEPRDARLVERPQDEHEHRARKHDPVGNQPVLEVGARDDDEDEAEDAAR